MSTSEREDVKHPVVYKVIGAPGTGKTTRVVGNPELGLDGLFVEHLDDYSLFDQMLVTYTNAGVDEAADRLEKMLDAPRYKIDKRVTTIHGQCFRALGLDREQTVDHWKQKDFCDIHDLEFGWDDEDDDIMAADKNEGNALFDLYGWLQSNCMDLEQWQSCPQDWTGDEDPLWLMEQWEAYKAERNYVGFGDMIEGVVETGYKQLENLGYGVLFPDDDTTNMEMFKEARHDPNRDPSVLRGKGAFVDAKVLYVDEVQDLTPLQWRWYLLQKLAVEKVFIGGDDDQTIYGWAGANPDFMLNEEGEFEVLEKTYRIPAEIWKTCDNVIQHVDHRQPKTVEPEGTGGEVVTIKRPSSRQLMKYLEDGECMILFRARYQIDEFRNDLHEYGIPYRNMSTYDTWSDELVKLRDALAKIDKHEGSIKGDELEILLEYADDHMVNDGNGVNKSETVMGQLGGISFDRLNEVFDLKVYGSDPTFKASTYLRETDEVNYYEKQAVVGCLNAGNYDMDPDRVRIGTIHSAKGKEAETVLLSTDSTKTILENMDTGAHADGGRMSAGLTVPQSPKGISDAERRVYYVGMTRASEKLILAEGVTDAECVIPIDALIGEDGRDDTTQGGQGTFSGDW